MFCLFNWMASFLLTFKKLLHSKERHYGKTVFKKRNFTSSVCILNHSFTIFEITKHKTKINKWIQRDMAVKNNKNKKMKWYWRGERKGRRKEHNHCTPPSLDAAWFLCEWSGTVRSTNRKSQAVSQKWNSISWDHNSRRYDDWQTENQGAQWKEM